MFTSTGNKQDQDNTINQPDKETKRVLATCGLIVLSAVGFIVGAKKSGFVDMEGVKTIKDAEKEFGTGLQFGIRLLAVKSQLSKSSAEDLISEGRQHAVYKELSEVIDSMRRHIGIGHLEGALHPADQISPERQLYEESVLLIEAIDRGDAKQIEILKPSVLQAIQRRNHGV